VKANNIIEGDVDRDHSTRHPSNKELYSTCKKAGAFEIQ
jgi:hypothetical protein